MHPILTSLLEIVEKEPLPEEYTSSHWKIWGDATCVSNSRGTLVLDGKGIGEIAYSWQNVVNILERLFYKRISSHLKSYNSIWAVTEQVAGTLSFGLTYDAWKYAMVLSTLSDHWKAYGLAPKTFCLIGDGHGFLGAILHHLFPEARLYFIDLPKILIFQARTLVMAAPGKSMGLFTGGESKAGQINFVIPQEVEKVSDHIDCAINVNSMQEMGISTIQYYFNFLRRRSDTESRFYCLNRVHKELPGGEIIAFDQYPWRDNTTDNDEIFLDEVCPFQRYFLSVRPYTRNEHGALTKGPQIFSLRIPFIHYFDGPSRHRIVHLASI